MKEAGLGWLGALGKIYTEYSHTDVWYLYISFWSRARDDSSSYEARTVEADSESVITLYDCMKKLYGVRSRRRVQFPCGILWDSA
jgi:hypothetical protein